MSTLINLDFHRWPFRYFRKRRQEFIDSNREELKGSRFHSRLWHQYGYWLWQITRYEFKIARINGGLAIGECIIRFCGAADRIFGCNLTKRHSRALQRRIKKRQHALTN